VPADVVPTELSISEAPRFFELQIKTLFQHAWSEAEHDLGCKAPVALSRPRAPTGIHCRTGMGSRRDIQSVAWRHSWFGYMTAPPHKSMQNCRARSFQRTWLI
jgi:hypothetical protein